MFYKTEEWKEQKDEYLYRNAVMRTSKTIGKHATEKEIIVELEKEIKYYRDKIDKLNKKNLEPIDFYPKTTSENRKWTEMNRKGGI